jgi:hypothetical protein
MPDGGAVRRVRVWPRRVFGFSAGVPAVWVPLRVYVSTGAG